MDVNIEGWLETKGYDISEKVMDDNIWDEIVDSAEEQAQMAIDEDMDNIGQEIVIAFKIKKKVAVSHRKDGDKIGFEIKGAGLFDDVNYAKIKKLKSNGSLNSNNVTKGDKSGN